MASIINVDQIKNAAGTSGLTLDASTGKASFPNGATLPAGSIIQVKQVSTGATLSTTNTSYVDMTNMTLSITPSSTSSKILILASLSCAAQRGGTVDIHGSTRLMRDTTEISRHDIRTYDFGVGGIYIMGTLAYSYTDAPSTTSAVTYRFQMCKVAANTSSMDMNPESNKCEMVLMEIAQ
jgi:hypothetical protein